MLDILEGFSRDPEANGIELAPIRIIVVPASGWSPAAMASGLRKAVPPQLYTAVDPGTIADNLCIVG